jgi:hypothetical protein
MCVIGMPFVLQLVNNGDGRESFCEYDRLWSSNSNFQYALRGLPYRLTLAALLHVVGEDPGAPAFSGYIYCCCVA